MKTVLIFGVFDGVHEGHRMFIRDAKLQGDVLVALVARDTVVESLKGKKPLHDEATRIEELLEVPEVDRAYLGDLQEGSYAMLKEVNPDILYLGYDQQALDSDLRHAMDEGRIPRIEIGMGAPYKPDVYKSSLLNSTDETRD